MVAKKKTVAKATKAVDPLIARVAALEAQVVTLIDAFEFSANELRPVYGLAAIALVFDAVHKKLTK